MLKNGEIKFGDFGEECIKPITKSSILKFFMSQCSTAKVHEELEYTEIKQASMPNILTLFLKSINKEKNEST